MDFSSPANRVINKAFDGSIEEDSKGSFLVEFSGKCYNHCVKEITESNLSGEQRDCIDDCFSKAHKSLKLFKQDK